MSASLLGGEGASPGLTPEFVGRLDTGGWLRSTRAGTPTLVAHAHVLTPLYTRVPSEGAIKGVSGERWEPYDWLLLVEADQGRVLAPVHELRRLVLVLIALALGGVVLVSLRLSTSISAPILELQRGTAIVGGGDLEHRVGIERADEIGSLSDAFDAMTQRLQQTLASRDLLDLEVGERNRVEEELRRTLGNLARSNQDLEQFAYVASHDLQEPLRVVRRFTELFARRYSDQVDEKAGRWIGHIVEGTARMQDLIDALLAFSRVETQGREGAPVASGEAFERVLRGLALQIRDSGATVRREGDLPVVLVDESQLQQLLQNLVGNGIKYRAERPPEVVVQAAREGAWWRFTVTDNGVGIAPEFHERVFAIFQRLHARSEYEGTGIGLAIAKRIVERHEGEIGVESTVGQGSTFWFTLPAAGD
jgi:signal transduction histidine kinase